MVVTFRVDRVKESSVDDLSTVVSVGPFKGGIDLIRLDKIILCLEEFVRSYSKQSKW